MKTPKIKSEYVNILRLVGGKLTFKQMENIAILIEAERNETEKAFGGCKKCYGKGYATVRETVTAYTDFSGIAPHTFTIEKYKPCSCSRGEQIKSMITILKT